MTHKKGLCGHGQGPINTLVGRLLTDSKSPPPPPRIFDSGASRPHIANVDLWGSAPAVVTMRLGEIFIQKGIITQAQLEQALHAQLIYGGHLGTCLIEQGIVNEEQLGRVLSDSFKVPYAGVERFDEIPRSVIQTLPARTVDKVHAVPFEKHGKVLTVAMIDPTDLPTLDEVAFASGCRIDPWVAPEVRILQAMERYYDIPRRQRYIAVCRDLDRDNDGVQKSQAADGPRSTVPVSPFGDTMRGFVPPGEQGAPALPPGTAGGAPGLVPLSEANADHEEEKHPAAPVADGVPAQAAAAASAAKSAVAAPAVAARPASEAARAAAATAAAPKSPPAVSRPQPAAQLRPVPAPPPAPVAPAEVAGQEAVELQTGAPINWTAMRDEVPRNPEDRLADLFCAADDVETIARIVLDQTVRKLERCVLFNVKGTTAVLWGSRGLNLNQDKAAKVKMAITREPVFHLFLDEGAYRGPLPEEVGYQSFFNTLEMDRPVEVIVMPVYLEDRLVAIFYGDSGETEEIEGATEDFRLIVRKLSIALNLVVLKRKIRAL